MSLVGGRPAGGGNDDGGGSHLDLFVSLGLGPFCSSLSLFFAVSFP
jgi:hypothetical protein